MGKWEINKLDMLFLVPYQMSYLTTIVSLKLLKTFGTL